MPLPSESSRALGRLRVVAAVSLLVVCGVVAVITFRQSPPDPDGQQELLKFLRRAHARGLPSWISLTTIEFASNIVMFTPIGFFGALVLTRHRWQVVPAAAAASVIIETYQALRLPERVGSVADVIANTLGTLIGFLLAWWLVTALRRRAVRVNGTAVTGPIWIVDGRTGRRRNG